MRMLAIPLLGETLRRRLRSTSVWTREIFSKRASYADKKNAD